MTDTQVTPQPRELETAPLLLRKASKVLIAGAALPWITAVATEGHMPWGNWAGGVVLTFLAGFVMVEAVKARRGLPANGAVAGVAKSHALAGTGLGLLIFIGAVVVAFLGKAYFDGEPGRFVGNTIDAALYPKAEDRYGLRAIMEHATLLLGLATFAHILDYEYGGKFNPIFPLMFLGPALAGSFQLIGAFGAFGDNSLGALLSLVGSSTVAAGGFMAIYTMYASMKQAKVEGDLKRAAQLEARKAARVTGGGGGAARRPRS